VAEQAHRTVIEIVSADRKLHDTDEGAGRSDRNDHVHRLSLGFPSQTRDDGHHGT
jgi:hypothetical protein